MMWTLFSFSYLLLLLVAILYFGAIESNTGVLFCVLLHLFAGGIMVRLNDRGMITQGDLWLEY